MCIIFLVKLLLVLLNYFQCYPKWFWIMLDFKLFKDFVVFFIKDNDKFVVILFSATIPSHKLLLETYILATVYSKNDSGDIF